MRRLNRLQNVLYKKKYKEIYKLVFSADLDRVVDYSYWYEKEQNYVTIQKPLWIVCESKLLNKRMWITHSDGELEISTANLSLNTDSSEYANSFKYYKFDNQKELVIFLEQLLLPCLEQENLKKVVGG